MAFGISSGQLSQVTGSNLPMPGASPVSVAVPGQSAGGGMPWEYAHMWRTQPNLRTMVGFLARNVAQLGLQVYRRVDDDERRREHQHTASALLDQPMPGMTGYRLVERIVSDLSIFDTAYLLKSRTPTGLEMLLPIPCDWVQILGDNPLAAEGYRIPSTRGSLDIEPQNMVAIHGYDPTDLRVGASPMEALRGILTEEAEANAFRSQMWRNGARMTGFITRPIDAPAWSREARDRFVESWRAYQRDGGKSGGTPLLEDGMQYQSASFNPQQAQYLEARKLTREEIAAAYHIPPPLVGILDNATYSNIREQHKQLYQDTLGPILRLIEQDLRLQLLTDLPDHDGLYVEFNVDDKLRGSFEEQASALQTAVGRPWMTAAEARARMNLPPVDDDASDADELVTPLNVMIGGNASPTDTAPDDATVERSVSPPTKTLDEASGALGTRDSERDVLADRLSRTLTAEAEKLSDLLHQPHAVGERDRLDRDGLVSLLGGSAFRLAQVGAHRVLDRHNPNHSGWKADAMWGWLRTAAESHTDGITHALRKALNDAATAADWPSARDQALYRWRIRAGMWATTIATEAVSFGGADAADVSGLSTKTWHAREQRHQTLDGETVALAGQFSNGLRFPADPTGGRDEVAGCVCDVSYARSS